MSRLTAFEEAFVRIQGSRGARIVGAAAGLVTIAMFVVALVRASSRGRDVLDGAEPWALALGLTGFAAFHVAAIAALGSLDGREPARVWASAQIAKYFPAPGAAVVGMVRASVLRGTGAAEALRLVGRHTTLLLGGAIVVGAPAAGLWFEKTLEIPASPPAVAVALIGLALAAAAARHPGAVIAAVGAWGALGIALGAGLGREEVLLTGSAFSAAWAVGLLALPVPAGIGVREAALVVLLEPWLGATDAITFAVLTRLLHVLSDGLLAALLLRRPAGAPRSSL